MNKSDPLFLLVHSLSKSEKRYFKLFCQHNGRDNDYLRLFAEVEKQETYDEAAIKERFAGEKFISQLHVAKHYLRHQILKCLRNYHAKISREAMIHDLLRNVEILFQKELYGLCATELQKAEGLARQYEQFAQLVDIHNWKRKLEQAQRPSNIKGLLKILEGQKKPLAMLENNYNHWRLALALADEGDLENASPVMKRREEVQIPLSLEAKVLFFNGQYFRLLRSGDDEGGEKALRQLLEMLAGAPHYVQENPGSYVSTVNNLVSLLILLKRYQDALAQVAKARAMYQTLTRKSRKTNLLKQTLRTYNLELEIYRDNPSLLIQEDFLSETKAFLQAKHNKIPLEYLISFWFQLAHIYFRRGNYRESLRWLNQILNTRFGDIRQDLQVQARMLNLIVHLEQKNYFVLRYFVDSTKRFMKKLKAVQPFEQVLLRFFVQIAASPVLEYKDRFAELYTKLFPSDGESLVPQNTLDYIDYRAWIEEKMES